MKIILPAKEIPVGSTVTKKSGQKKYILKDYVRIYNDGIVFTPSLIAGKDVLFLFDAAGNISAIAATTEIVWIVSDKDLHEYFHERFNI